jgi:NAD(P)-dependent dehydrogenase (short-subunit alcohol dehydrogenase family)
MVGRRVALVTGCSRGIGRVVAHRLGAEGIHVVFSARSLKLAKAQAEIATKSGASSEAIELDVRSSAACAEAVSKICDQHGRLDILINVAGVTSHRRGTGEICETTEQDVCETIDVNLLGAFRLVRLVLPLMLRQKWGRIVNVSSEQASLDRMGASITAYKLSKVALNALTRIAADEGRPFVLVNSVAPGWCRTDMGGPEAPRSVEDGASSVVWAALLPDNGPTGGFFMDAETLNW